MKNKSDKHSEIFLKVSEKMKYGAPELKKYYGRYLFRGLFVGVTGALVLSVSSMYYILKANEKSGEEIILQERIINITETQLDLPSPVKEIKEISSPNTALKDLSALTPEPTAKRKVKENIKIKNQNELEEVTLQVSSEGTENISEVSTENTGKLDEVKIDKNIKTIKEQPDKPVEIFEVEKAPQAINLNSIKASIKYPESARRTGVEGNVVARLLIGADGFVIKIGKLTGPEEFHAEVSEKVMELRFTPAVMNNSTVKCWVSVPFKFKLEK